MQQYKAIIVDDEPTAQEMLEELLKDYPDIAVVSKESNAEDAINSIKKHQPDIIFLDIEMPGKDGLELAHEIRDHQIETTIVFITAYNQHAIEAFKVAAFDYLLKPIGKDELEKTIKRFKSQAFKMNLAEKLSKLSHCLAPEKIRFNTRTGFILVDPRSIVYCKADGNYTYLYLDSGNREHITQQIGKIEEHLNEKYFVRINRSVLINKNYISSFNRASRKVKLTNLLEVVEFKVKREAMIKLC